MDYNEKEIDTFIYLQAWALADAFIQIEKLMITGKRLMRNKDVELYMKEFESRLEEAIGIPPSYASYAEYKETFLTSSIYGICAKESSKTYTDNFIGLLVNKLIEDIKANPLVWSKYIEAAKFLLNNDGESDVNKCTDENYHLSADMEDL